MTSHPPLVRRSGWAGLAAGPLAWGISTQLNYALAPYTCTQYRVAVALVALALTLISFAGAYLSWLSFRDGDLRAGLQDTAGGSPRRMLALFGLFSGVLFGLTIAVQSAAGLILDGCLR
jgi:hypothetical protein